MSAIIRRIKIGHRENTGDAQIMCCGKGAGGEPLFVRHWRTRYDNIEQLPLLGDGHMFAPNVRQLRWRHGECHDAHAEKGITELYGKHEGKKFVIVGCGPSMPNALAAVKELHDKHDHIVIGTNVCMQHGYRPAMDYYMLLCWLTQAWWWRGVDTKNLKCITSFHTPFEVIRDFPNRYYFDDTFIDVTKSSPMKRKEFGTLDGGMTVIYSAMHLAVKMGAKRIVLVGMDLSYTNNMDHPGDPLNFEKAKKRNVFVDCDVNGNAVITDQTMSSQRDVIRGQSIMNEEDGIEMVNATGAGILDLGCRMSPEEYLADVETGTDTYSATIKEKQDAELRRGAAVASNG